MAAHLVAAYVLGHWLQNATKDPGQLIIERTYNSATFAASAMLLAGVVNADTLKALGTLKPYLLFAGFAGAAYSIRALFRP
jgi:hypothetical protein